MSTALSHSTYAVLGREKRSQPNARRLEQEIDAAPSACVARRVIRDQSNSLSGDQMRGVRQQDGYSRPDYRSRIARI